jgi:hypothetical protein
VDVVNALPLVVAEGGRGGRDTNSFCSNWMTTYGSGLAGADPSAVDVDVAVGMERFRAEMSLIVRVPRGDRSELDDDDDEGAVAVAVAVALLVLVLADTAEGAPAPVPAAVSFADPVSLDPPRGCASCCTFSTPSFSNFVVNPLFPLTPAPSADAEPSCFDNALLIFGGSLSPKPPV